MALLIGGAVGAWGQRTSDCDLNKIQQTQQLTFQQRACLTETRLIAPSMLLRAALSGGYGQWRNDDPHVRNEHMADFGRRFGNFYARQAGQNAGELLAGYLHHENPRFSPSMEHGFWNRARSALFSVVVAKDGNGDGRLALAPIAGSFGDGFVGMAVSDRHDHFRDGLRRTGGSYAGYFGTALMREFHPDFATFATRILHRKKQDPDSLP